MLYKTINPHGGDTYDRDIHLDFSANVNPYGTPEGVLRAVRDSFDSLSKYPDPYCRRLIQKIAEFEGVNADNILCGLGAAELLYAFASAVRPEHVLETAPTFSEYSAALLSVGSNITRFTLTRENDFCLTEDILDVLERGDFDAVFLCTPNNPTGRLIDPQLLEKVIALCRRKKIRLVLDECFLDLSDAGLDISMKKHLVSSPNLLILRSFTKSYGMAGLRLGYALSSDTELLHNMSSMSQPWNIPTPTQAAGIAALCETDFLERTRQTVSHERAYLQDALLNMGFYVCPPQANYILFHSDRPIYEELLKRKILVRNCENYHGLGKGYVRIAVRLHDENAKLIAAIRDIHERK